MIILTPPRLLLTETVGRSLHLIPEDQYFIKHKYPLSSIKKNCVLSTNFCSIGGGGIKSSCGLNAGNFCSYTSPLCCVYTAIDSTPSCFFPGIGLFLKCGIQS
jgi:hypothetical protein